MLEPCDAKVSSTVLRGLGDRKVAWLLGKNAKQTLWRKRFGGRRTLRFLWKFQRGFCPVCNTKITRITGWRLHYCVPRVMGGSTSPENRVLLHPECHDRVHCQRISVSKPRLPERGVGRA
jgi:5-methylcytosine-specific restriction endonuclease McrA